MLTIIFVNFQALIAIINVNLSLKSRAFDTTYPLVIALDGSAGSGKSTIGRIIAEQLSLTYHQSGIWYRAVACICINKKIDLKNIKKIIDISTDTNLLHDIFNQSPTLTSVNLNDEDVGDIASQIAIIEEVRRNLTKQQRLIINKSHRILMEGRDITTCVAPNADLKIFITADINIRAQRRYKQLRNQKKHYIMSDVLNYLSVRDHRDANRKASPMLQDKDALKLDTSKLTSQEVVDQILSFIRNN